MNLKKKKDVHRQIIYSILQYSIKIHFNSMVHLNINLTYFILDFIF